MASEQEVSCDHYVKWGDLLQLCYSTTVATSDFTGLEYALQQTIPGVPFAWLVSNDIYEQKQKPKMDIFSGLLGAAASAVVVGGLFYFLGKKK